MPLRDLLLKSLRAPLWGDRERWGLTPAQEDPCWQEWQNTYVDFYQANQREGIGTRVNDAGYAVMSSIDLTGKRVLEIGAGDIRHMKYWRGDWPLPWLPLLDPNLVFVAVSQGPGVMRDE